MAYMQLGDAQFVLDYLKLYYKHQYNEEHGEVRLINIEPIKSKIPNPPVMPAKVRTTPFDSKNHKVPMFESHDNYDAIREIEKEHCKQMRYHFNQAAKAFRRGDGKTAKREAQEGKKYKNLYLAEKFAAVERTLSSKNSNLNQNTIIDLHGLHENEVEYVLDTYIGNIQGKLNTGEIVHNRGANRGHCITVITGKGNNSRNFKPVVKNSVRSFLKRNGIGFKEGDGYITVIIV
jgi:DNA-nicking Smr family endonuclease